MRQRAACSISGDRPDGSPGAVRSRLRSILASIPRGRVATYGQVAALAGIPHDPRSPVRLLRTEAGLPWHRVVGAGGRIALSAEAGREQRLRLEMEGVRFRGRKVPMERFRWEPRISGRRAPPAPAGPKSARRRGPSARAATAVSPRRLRIDAPGPRRPDRRTEGPHGADHSS